MQKFLILLCLGLLSFGCSSKKEKATVIGPLNEIKTYQVFPILLSLETSEKEVLFDQLVEMLKQLGQVVITTNCISDSPASVAMFCISLSEYDGEKAGSINVFAESEVVANGYKTSSDIWNTIFIDPSLPYPVDGENGISFRKDELSKSPAIEVVAAEMIAKFAEQFKQDNPGSRPTFQIYKKV